MTEATYQAEARVVGALVDEEVEALLDAVNPSIAKRLARQAVRDRMWRAIYGAAHHNQMVLERQRRVQLKEQTDAKDL